MAGHISTADPEKNSGSMGIEPIVEAQGSPLYDTGMVEPINPANLIDERYATTKRGLKSRHAQMIALGGAIGTG